MVSKRLLEVAVGALVLELASAHMCEVAWQERKVHYRPGSRNLPRADCQVLREDHSTPVLQYLEEADCFHCQWVGPHPSQVRASLDQEVRLEAEMADSWGLQVPEACSYSAPSGVCHQVPSLDLLATLSRIQRPCQTVQLKEDQSFHPYENSAAASESQRCGNSQRITDNS